MEFLNYLLCSSLGFHAMKAYGLLRAIVLSHPYLHSQSVLTHFLLIQVSVSSEEAPLHASMQHASSPRPGFHTKIKAAWCNHHAAKYAITADDIQFYNQIPFSLLMCYIETRGSPIIKSC